MGLAAFNRARRLQELEKHLQEKEERVVLESLKMPELKELADNLNIEYNSGIKKAELIELIQNPSSDNNGENTDDKGTDEDNGENTDDKGTDEGEVIENGEGTSDEDSDENEERVAGDGR